MQKKTDKLGRKIPQFDRVAAGKKSVATRKAKDANYYARIGAIGGRNRTRGYLGKLKDTGDEQTLKSITRRGAEESNASQGKNRKKELTDSGQ